MKQYTKEDICKKISIGNICEDESIELKKRWTQSSGKSISSIGNRHQGGWLIIGIDDNGYLLNTDSQILKTQKIEIENHIKEYLKPNSAVQFISITSINKNDCILIEIINPGHIVSWNKKFYKRVGSQTLEMSPDEKKALELKFPGLDFSDHQYNGKINSSLVLDFAHFLPTDNGDWTFLPAHEVLSKLSIENKNVSGILFGDFTFRLIHYNENSEVLDQKEESGLHKLLKNDFIQHIQSWTRTQPIFLKSGSLSVSEENPYPDAVLREILVNAVAHSAFEKNRHEVKVELYRNRITISNYCSSEVIQYMNKKFSKDHYSYNPFLMKILRMAKFSDELGSGKNKIFRTMIENGRREPLFEYQKISNDYGIWSVTIYNEQPNKNFLSLLKRLKKIYNDNMDKYKISAALILWKDKTLKDILAYMDEYHQRLTKDILKEDNSPFLSTTDNIPSKILLKRWAKIQLEGQESKIISSSEENQFKIILQSYVYKDGRKGLITNKEARHLLGFSIDSQSEAVQLSKLFQKWEKEKFVKKEKKRGYWKIKRS